MAKNKQFSDNRGVFIGGLLLATNGGGRAVSHGKWSRKMESQQPQVRCSRGGGHLGGRVGGDRPVRSVPAVQKGHSKLGTEQSHMDGVFLKRG